jgi:hypothetical protein
MLYFAASTAYPWPNIIIIAKRHSGVNTVFSHTQTSLSASRLIDPMMKSKTSCNEISL